MKKIFIIIMISVLVPSSLVFSQTLMDYVSEVRGDTLVIKDYWDMTEENTLTNAINLDVDNVPAGRVYMLKTNGYYPLVNNPTTLRPTVIAGEDNTILVNNKKQASNLPLICGAAPEGVGANTGGINFAYDLLVKNVSIVPATSKQDLGWNFFGSSASDVTLTIDNCLFERTRWVFMGGFNPGLSFVLKNSYFVNMVGQPCRRNGGVYDGFSPMDSLVVENCTHINAQGLMYKLRANQFNRVILNHNTFVNMSSLVLLDLGSQSALSVTNNIFVNCQVQPYGPINLDVGEEDIDKLPIGIVNVYPDTAVHKDRKYLVDNNVVYWDSRLADVPATLNANKVNGSDKWVSQMITMNTRTQAMFDDNAAYPYLTEGKWITELPNFTDSKDLLTTQVDLLKTFSASTCDTLSTDVLTEWRLVSIGADNYLYADFPIPVDLSYNNANLLTAATNGFPVGDLNWFPAKKVEWNAQRAAEYAAIDNALETGTTDVKELGGLPVDFNLAQNYPNPFNPTTNITFSLPEAGNVTLKIYNAIGKEVATLISGYKSAQSYSVEFNASGMTSGIYIYKLEYGNRTYSKKMLLLK